jgi:hypothetical protein
MWGRLPGSFPAAKVVRLANGKPPPPSEPAGVPRAGTEEVEYREGRALRLPSPPSLDSIFTCARPCWLPFRDSRVVRVFLVTIAVSVLLEMRRGIKQWSNDRIILFGMENFDGWPPLFRLRKSVAEKSVG